MFDQQKRFKNFTAVNTGPHLGPDHYTICETDILCRTKSWAPFLQTSKASSIIPSMATDAIYNIKDKQKITGGNIDRTPRFIYKEPENSSRPYNLKFIECKKEKKLDPSKPKLYMCRNDYLLYKTAPSIPSKLQKNGYYENKYGLLVAIPEAPEIHECEPPRQSTCERYRGCKWSCRTAQRMVYKAPDGPGPQAYNVSIPKCKERDEDIIFREMAARFSYVPRFIDAQQIRTIKEGLPGPGCYEADITCIKSRQQSSLKKPFISSNPRFKCVTSDTPSPSAYIVIPSKCKGASMKCIRGFNVLADRWPKNNKQVFPGPGSYNIPSEIAQKLQCKQHLYDVKCTPFLSSTKRETMPVPSDAACTVGPADYPVEEDISARNLTDKRSYPFKSKIDRFPELCDEGPAPLNITPSFKLLTGKCKNNAYEIPFNTYAKRPTFLENKMDIPGPGEYCPDEVCCKSMGYSFGKSKRWRQTHDDLPGPNIYKIPSTSLYNALHTFNFKLKQNMLKKKIHSADYGYKKWCMELKKKKRLKWVESDYQLKILKKYDALMEKIIAHGEIC